MFTLQLEIPDELAEKLSPYHDQLPELLELGLQVWLERERQERLARGERLLEILATSDKVRLPEPYTDERPYRRHTACPHHREAGQRTRH